MTDSKLIPVWEWLKKKRKLILFVCGIIVLIWIILLIAKTYLWSYYWVSTDSMSPTLEKWDHVFVKKFGYTIKRWDIIAFNIDANLKNIPRNAIVTDKGNYIKLCLWTLCEKLPKKIMHIARVIWLPWDTIKLDSWNILLCKNSNCEQIDESSYLPWIETKTICWKTKFYMSGGYFVLSDNRSSLLTDSRCCFAVNWCTTSWSNYEISKNDILGVVR